MVLKKCRNPTTTSKDSTQYTRSEDRYASRSDTLTASLNTKPNKAYIVCRANEVELEPYEDVNRDREEIIYDETM